MKKNFIALMVSVGLLTSIAMPSMAQGVPADIQAQLDLIAQLTEQIQQLQAQLLELQKEADEVKQQRHEAVTQLMEQLDEGEESEDVTVLQTLLAADPDVYPEGLITGYFGPLTKKAVKRFQKKNGIEQVGRVGPQTLRALNKHMNKNKFQIALVEDDADTDGDGDVSKKRVCSIVPPGHLIAPGWLRKHGNAEQLVPECQNLPPGIAKKVNGDWTPGDDDEEDEQDEDVVDETAPVISAIAETAITHESATIEWMTDENADSAVYYSETTPFTMASATAVSATDLVTDHSIQLTGLTADTTYYYVVVSSDAEANEAQSAERSFTTLAEPDTTAPVISSLVATAVTHEAATIEWSTDEDADSIVYYGMTSPLDTASSAQVADTSLLSDHSVVLNGLEAETTYYYVVSSEDASGNSAQSGEFSFTTDVAPDETAPVISDIATADITSSTATVSWTTDESATTVLYYGTVTPLETASATMAEVAGTDTAHSVSLSDLSASSTYYFIAESEDAAGNTALSAEGTFTTLGE